MRRMVLVLASALLASGCAAREAQVATQTALTAMAEGVNAAGQVIMEHMPAAADDAREHIAAQVQADGLSTEEAMDMYDRAMASWVASIYALEVSRDVLQTGQSGLDIWVDTGDLPESWGAFCNDIETSLLRVLDLFETLGLEPPAMLRSAARYSSEVCIVTADYFVVGEEPR